MPSAANQKEDEETLLSFTATATDQDLPPPTLTFSLLSLHDALPIFTSCTVPTGASITAGGSFSWTPTESQGPGTYRFFVKVTDNGTPALSDENGRADA